MLHLSILGCLFIQFCYFHKIWKYLKDLCQNTNSINFWKFFKCCEDSVSPSFLIPITDCNKKLRLISGICFSYIHPFLFPVSSWIWWSHLKQKEFVQFWKYLRGQAISLGESTYYLYEYRSYICKLYFIFTWSLVRCYSFLLKTL